ncbi:keratin, type I cytoskeletal 14-like [Sebastes umbrosus]|uniref:keratin, type I cytoskeletal 14-like n=1 Tax=Sebastes umbrosus TaxID=72105 RepID=UPI00189CD05E|nr:keratin, type I cytoskeletal 14-like [Sebastes umbrosus]
MENLFDFEGGSVAYGVFTASTDQKDELITSLTSFVRLYGQRRDYLQRASESFTLAAARLHDEHEDIAENKPVRCLFSVFGGVLGAACGAVTGGVGGALGAVSAATCTRFCGHINALGATFGFVGSVLGGVVGGTFCGAVGGAVCAAATGGPVHGVVSDVAWFTIGGATGGAIGGIFGGTVGAAGGAVGGAFGALCATRFAVFLVGHFCRKKDSKDEKTKSMKVKMMQKSGHFSETIKPLVDELKTIKTVSDKMASAAAVRGVAGQTAKTLTSVTAMEKSISDSQRASDLLQFVSSVEEAARQSRRITEDLETTRAEVETYLVSTRKL